MPKATCCSAPMSQRNPIAPYPPSQKAHARILTDAQVAFETADRARRDIEEAREMANADAHPIEHVTLWRLDPTEIEMLLTEDVVLHITDTERRRTLISEKERGERTL
jgi:hypothetical protein